MENRKQLFIMLTVIYFIGSIFILLIGIGMVSSAEAGVEFYRQTLGHFLPVPSHDTFKGIGMAIIVLGGLLTVGGIIERFFCPFCPFPFMKRWESPTVQNTK